MWGADPLGVAADRHALAAILDAQCRHREALALLQEALALVEAILGCDHYEVALVVRTMGEVAERAGDPEQAAAHYRRALDIQQRVLGPDHADVAKTRTRLRRAVRIAEAER